MDHYQYFEWLMPDIECVWQCSEEEGRLVKVIEKPFQLCGDLVVKVVVAGAKSYDIADCCALRPLGSQDWDKILSPVVGMEGAYRTCAVCDSADGEYGDLPHTLEACVRALKKQRTGALTSVAKLAMTLAHSYYAAKGE